MALLSDYTAGTVTVAAGGTAVTGVGTAWLTAGFQEGDEFFAPGWHGIVQSVNSNTSLTLYPIGIRGAALAGSAYRLRYQGDGSRLTAQARQLIQLLGGGGNLEALGGLSGAANTFPIFTGAGTMDVATLTAFFRGLMDAADGSDLYSQMGEISNGQLPDRLRSIPSSGSPDADTLTSSGFYNVTSTTANIPEAGQGALIVCGVASSVTAQLYIRAQTGTLWVRPRALSAWGTWRRLSMERGSNANGEYVRFGDGTQICTGLLDSGDIDSPTGSLFANSPGVVAWTFPVAFAAAPSISGSQSGSSTRWVNPVSRSTTVGNFRVLSSTTGTTIGFGVSAIGRWF
ncbi:pyocin knob domain-containing protein [Neorhizobium sp. Rsf11]|uniref:Pyocin knob domain-containing protein n=1 Tax=Neorhizobium phenanthreniclasticum TaxID=3157917 RepID=A0ABV0M7R9_9HYPH